MISRLPKWVWTGASLLAFVAGFINVIGLMGFHRQAVTHLTGITSMVAADIAILNFPDAVQLFSVLLSFMFGCIVSGFIVRESALQLGGRYGIALFLESLLLYLSVPLLKSNHSIGMCFASCACGLQNAMVTTYSGTVVRTTHLSGMFTDLGIFLGHFLRGLDVDQRRLRLCLLIIGGFFLGGIAGTRAFLSFGYSALLIPATLIFSVSVLYGSYKVYAAELA